MTVGLVAYRSQMDQMSQPAPNSPAKHVATQSSLIAKVSGIYIKRILTASLHALDLLGANIIGEDALSPWGI
jgi:hypothetical protein